MALVHTLLFFIRSDHYSEDILQAEHCLYSLSQSKYKNVVVYNQGCISNAEVLRFADRYDLNCTVLGDGTNVGIVEGRQACFEYVWRNFPEAGYVSELHLDMVFSAGWENSLLEYLHNYDEPMISCGIIDQAGLCAGLPENARTLPHEAAEWDGFLKSLQRDLIIPGFTHPCIHVLKILEAVGGYDTEFLKGTQCYEDDSLLLSYYYYYGTRRDWRPQINYNSVVYHGVAAQRLGLGDGLRNYIGLIQQYGIMGQRHLSELHANLWQKKFFKQQYDFLHECANNINAGK